MRRWKVSHSVVDRFYDALDARDFESWSDLLDDDVELTVDSRAIRGRDAARLWAASSTRAHPRVVAGSRRVVAESPGTVVCELQLAAGGAARPACEILRLRGDRIVSLRSFAGASDGVDEPEARRELERMADERAALRRVAELVARGESQAAVLDAVAHEAWRLLGGHFTALLRYEPDGPAVIVAMHGAEAVSHVMYVGMRLATEGDGVVQRVRSTARAARIDSYAGIPGSNAGTARELDLTCGAGAPIITEGRVWGAITVLSRRPLPATVETRLALFAELVATAVANAQSQTALQALAEEQASLRRVAELVAHGVAQQEAFDAVALEAARLIGEDAVLGRFDADQRFEVIARSGGPFAVGSLVEIGGSNLGLVAEILRARRAARVDDYTARDGPSVARDAYGIGATVGAPIVMGDRLWGVLVAVTSGARFPSGTESRLQQFAELVAASLASAQARAEVRALADEQSALRRVAELVALAVPSQDVFAAVAKEASGLLGGQAMTLTRFEGSRALLVVATYRGPAPVGTTVTFEADTLPDWVRRDGRAVRVDDYREQRDAALAAEFGLAAAVAAPVVVAGEVWGMLTATSDAQPLPAGTEARLQQFAELVAAALANAENTAKLTASRARVVATADDTRRRLQRDVHDAAQQRLVHTIIALKLARDAIAAGGEATELVNEALSVAERADRDLRDVVRGILPASLARGGLRAGLESLIVDLPVPVDLRVTAPRLAAQIETTGYFVVAEALTNVVKHAHAGRAVVTVTVDDATLSIDVHDDGTGGADPERGTGLTGLLDRIEANEGTLTITSPPGQGTTLHATLPLTPPAASGVATR